MTAGPTAGGGHPDATRDRDAEGRARSARPRDVLGRPLPRGERGVATVPEDLDVGPADGLELAQRYLDDGMPFHAHEVLETVWKSSPGPERELWQGLAQLAVGVTHLLRGNAAGARALLARGAARLGPWAGTSPHGVDVDGLRAVVGAALAEGAADQAEPPVPALVLRRPAHLLPVPPDADAPLPGGAAGVGGPAGWRGAAAGSSRERTDLRPRDA